MSTLLGLILLLVFLGAILLLRNHLFRRMHKGRDRKGGGSL